MEESETWPALKREAVNVPSARLLTLSQTSDQISTAASKMCMCGVILLMMTALKHLLRVWELLVRGLKAVIVEYTNTHTDTCSLRGSSSAVKCRALLGMFVLSLGPLKLSSCRIRSHSGRENQSFNASFPPAAKKSRFVLQLQIQHVVTLYNDQFVRLLNVWFPSQGAFNCGSEKVLGAKVLGGDPSQEGRTTLKRPPSKKRDSAGSVVAS